MAIIAISRGTFSGGEALAKAVAERLGYRCLSREMNLANVARTYGVPTVDLTTAMEKRPSFLERKVGEHSVYLRFVRAALCEQAREDNLVYHGHLGHLLLAGIAHVIGVRVVAEPAYRLQAVQKQQSLNREEAQAYIEKMDRERRAWTQFLFGVDWNDPHLYHLVLNLSRISLQAACETMAHLVGRPEFQPTPASRKAVEDVVLSSRVEAMLAKDYRTRSAEVTITADDGLVTVSGWIRWPEVERAIPEVVRRVEGVKEVRSRIVLGTSSPPR